MTKIEITDEEAALFVEFQKHRDLFHILDKTGALDTQYGKIILNCAGGVVQNIVIEHIAWKR